MVVPLQHKLTNPAVCPTTAIAKAWVMTLRAVAQRHNANELLVTSYLEVIEAATAASWKAAIRDVPKGDKDRALINMERLTRMFYKMNYNLPKDSIRLLFSTFDGDRSGELDFDEFTNLWKLVKIRRDIRPIFDSLAESSGSDGEVVVTSRKFRHFLSSVQKVLPSTDFPRHVLC